MRALTGTLLAAAVSLGVTLPRTGMAHPRSALTIDNDRREALVVEIDDRPIGAVPGRSELTFAVPSGAHEIEVRAGRDLLMRRVVHFDRHQDEVLRFAAPTGTVLLENRSGTVLEVQVDGMAVAALRDGERRGMTLEVGRHEVVATYVQLGGVYTLAATCLRLDEGEREQVRLDPIGIGRIEVANRTGRDAELQVGMNGASFRPFGLIRAGERRVVELPLGGAWVRLVDLREGFTLDEQRLAVRAYADQVVVAQAPRFGRATVRNEGGAFLRLYVDGAFRETLQPWEREMVELSVGVHRLELRDHRGRTVQRATVAVNPYEVAVVAFGDDGHRHDDRRERYGRDDGDGRDDRRHDGDVASNHVRPAGR